MYVDDSELESGLLKTIAANSTVTVEGDLYFDGDSIYFTAYSIKDEDGNEVTLKEDTQKNSTSQTAGTAKNLNNPDYIIPDSDRVLLGDSDVAGLSLQEINYAKNEIYARHGRLFASTELQNYFNSKSWYQGTIAPENFSESMLSDVEKKNAEFLKDVEYSIAPDGYQLDQ